MNSMKSYVYFGDTGNKSDDGKSSDIDVVIQNFNGQIIVQTDD